MNYNKLKQFENKVVCTKESNKYYITEQMDFWTYTEQKSAHVRNYDTYKRIIRKIEQYKDQDASLYLHRVKNNEHYKTNKSVKRYVDDFIKDITHVNFTSYEGRYDCYSGLDGNYYIDKNNIIKCNFYERSSKYSKRDNSKYEYAQPLTGYKPLFIMDKHPNGILIQKTDNGYFFRIKEVIPTVVPNNYIGSFIRNEYLYHKGKQLNKKELKKYGYIK